MVTAILDGVFPIRVLGCQELHYVYLTAIQHTAFIFVQCSSLLGIVSTLEESHPALITGDD